MNRNRLAALVVGIALATSGLATTASASTHTTDSHGSQAACGASKYAKPANTHSTRVIVTGSCGLIRIKPGTTRNVKVCFKPSSGGTQCVNKYTYAKKGQWTTLATDVKAGTKYLLNFKATNKSSGLIAD
ncbi:hypothetical protein [Streptomyces sp. NPDC056061]|uniref:hypothetical protein n=1 Tax=Streptomyces sp. NPDC056061 TaxID=3345700 RepID=UPI0035D64D32